MLIRCIQCNNYVHTLGGYILTHMRERGFIRDVCDASNTPYVIGCCSD